MLLFIKEIKRKEKKKKRKELAQSVMVVVGYDNNKIENEEFRIWNWRGE